jgi:hypothetical protein
MSCAEGFLAVAGSLAVDGLAQFREQGRDRATYQESLIILRRMRALRKT